MRGGPKHHAFTLVELLVVVGIIGLLIGILLPSLRGARISAKNAQTASQLESIQQALEMFNNDVGDYPESAKRVDPSQDSTLGGDQGACIDPLDDSFIYGAQSLVYGLMGRDLKGYVIPKRARKFDDSWHPCAWYIDRDDDDPEDFPRETLYINETNNVKSLNEIVQGTRPAYGDYITTVNLNTYVMLDSFERPILYYKCNNKGRNKILCSNARDGDVAAYDPDNIPYYNLLDNELFTGDNSVNQAWTGWRFAPVNHQLRYIGEAADPDDLTMNIDPFGEKSTFAQYIHDHKSEGSGKIRPAIDTYMLIAAGEDGIYGTPDDITNFKER